MDNKKENKFLKILKMDGVGVFLALIVFMILVAILSPILTGGTFLTYTNITNVFRQQAHLGIICCAMTFLIITGNIDLSVGSMMTLIAIIISDITFTSPWLAILAGLGLGLFFGALNGFLVSGLRLNPFISTLATSSIYGSLALIISEGYTLRQSPEPVFDYIANGNVLGLVPCNIVICFLVILISGFFLRRSVFGKRLYAIGANPKAARYSGIRSRLNVFICYCLVGLSVGLASILLIARSVSSNPQVAGGKEMDIILAVVLGGTSVLGGKGSIFGTVVGFLFLGFMSSGFVFLGMNQYMQWIIMGVILVAALALDVSSGKEGKKWKRKTAEKS